MSAGVLAVMDAAVSSLGAVPGKNADARKLREARATVAELMEVLREARASWLPVPTGGNIKRKASQVEFNRRVDAALARCGGAQ